MLSRNLMGSCWRAITVSPVLMLFVLFGSVRTSYAHPLIRQEELDASCIPRFAVGTNPHVPLPAGCTNGNYCPDYGPPLDYVTVNKDHAVGGNLPFSDYTDPKNIVRPNGGEAGWKDTADLKAGEIIRILVRWTPSDVPMIAHRSYTGENLYQFDPTDGTMYGTVMSSITKIMR